MLQTDKCKLKLFKLSLFFLSLISKMFKSIICLIICYILSVQIQSFCPIQCKCTNHTTIDFCRICLLKSYNRNVTIISSSSNVPIISCPCRQSYKQIIPIRNYCCSNNCLQCYQQGCYSCKKNWTRILQKYWYICKCKDNYYFDQVVNDCLCSNRDPSLENNINIFYEPNRFECFACPVGCLCNISGCYYCNSNLNRQILLSGINIYACYCKKDYYEIDQLCVFKTNLPIIINNISVKPKCSCKLNTCGCLDPYYCENDQCVCKSKLDPTGYYLFKGKCFFCPYLCKCNQLGCVYCEILVNITMSQNHCICTNNTLLVKNYCACSHLYDNSTCFCNSFQYPKSYYQDRKSDCRVCPQGCICNQSGCIYCQQNTRRNSDCTCINNLSQIDNKCIGCPINFIFINKTCSCPNQVYINLSDKYYYDEGQKNCKICPIDCNCNIYGCYACNSSSNRIITINTNNISICSCNNQLNFQQNQYNMCECIFPNIFNSPTNKCQCYEPYYINNSKCVCLSNKYPTQYYLYVDGNCRKCPNECNCTSEGCVWCSQRSSRSILREYFSNGNQIYICPCFPIQLQQPINSCISCSISQYNWKNQCINCDLTCLTCDQNGCLSCNNFNLKNNNITPVLINHSCICPGDYHNNVGTCYCKLGYFPNKNGNCSKCPVYCKDCDYNQRFRSNSVRCHQCNQNVFRKNYPLNNCPCIEDYVQKYKQYCCHKSCEDCDMNGCISCLPLNFRQLNITDPNHKICSCMKGFIEQNNTCICPPRQFVVDEQCLSCPQFCSSCSYVEIIGSGQSIINCSCIASFNRIQISLKSGSNIYGFCVCQLNFFQYEESPYCYPLNCKNYSNHGHCAQCIDNRTLSSDGLYCNCEIAYYEDQNSNCQMCGTGCIKCIDNNTCSICNSSQGYYMASDVTSLSSSCFLPSSQTYLLFYFDNQLTFEIRVNEQKFSWIDIDRLELLLIQDQIQIKRIPTYNISGQLVQNHTILVKFTIQQQVIRPPFTIYINSTLRNINQENSTQQKFERYYLSNNYIYTKTYSLDSQYQVFIYLFVIFICITTLVFSLLGRKQNQLLFYTQTVYFMTLNIYDPKLIIIPYFRYFSYLTFNFVIQGADNPFAYIISTWDYFIQYSKGNYLYFVVDNNFIRNAGLPFYLFCQNIVLFPIMYVVYFKILQSQNQKHKHLVRIVRKPVYRLLQWINKLVIYPVQFFAWSTIIFYNKQYSLVNQSFRTTNLLLSVFVIITIALQASFSIFFLGISRYSKCETLIQYILDTIISINIVCSVYSNTILIVIPLLFLRNILQILNRYFWFRRFNLPVNILLVFWHILQSVSLILFYYLNLTATFVTFSVYIVGLIALNIYEYCDDSQFYRFQRQKLKEAQVRRSKQKLNISSDSEAIMR